MAEKSGAESAPPDADVRPDAWERFEHAVDKAAKAPPLHRPAAAPKTKPSKKG